MRLLFKQRIFSWLDSYDIYNEDGNTVFTVQGRLAWGHCLEIYSAQGDHAGTVKEEIFTFLPRFAIYLGETRVGEIKKEFTFFRPVFTLSCNDWTVEGDFMGWDYTVTDGRGDLVMKASKELLHWSDVYSIEVGRPEDALLALMIVLAIDAAKCSQSD